MGIFLYGDAGIEIEIDDRTLAHLQLVVSAKLRRKESFFLSWSDSQEVGGGRSSVWIESGVPLVFRYRTAKRHEINREWLEELNLSANQQQGLRLTPEPGSESGPPLARV